MSENTQPTPAPQPDRVASVAVAGGDLPVEIYLPPARSGRGLVLVQEIFGVSRYIQARARDLADLGYVVAVPQLYWRIGLVATPEDGPIEDVLGAGMGAAEELGLAPAIADTAASLRWLPTIPEVTGPAGLFGFCFGGGVAFAAAAQSDPAALVSYYGSAIPALLEVAGQVHAPSLHHWGEADTFIDQATQAHLRSVIERDGVEWYSYPEAGHAFDNPNPAFFSEPASRLAWQRTTAFLTRVLPLA